MPRPKVYVAGPLTTGGRSKLHNVAEALFMADWLVGAGAVPFVPHLTHFWHAVHPHDYQDWIEMDLEWLEVCDAVLRVRGESKGADREVEAAEALGIPVYTNVTELIADLVDGNVTVRS